MAQKVEILQADYFKIHCLELIDNVAEQGHEIIITKRGHPVAKLIPLDVSKPQPLWGLFKDQIRVKGDILQALSETWDADR